MERAVSTLRGPTTTLQLHGADTKVRAHAIRDAAPHGHAPISVWPPTACSLASFDSRAVSRVAKHAVVKVLGFTCMCCALCAAQMPTAQSQRPPYSDGCHLGSKKHIHRGAWRSVGAWRPRRAAGRRQSSRHNHWPTAFIGAPPIQGVGIALWQAASAQPSCTEGLRGKGGPHWHCAERKERKVQLHTTKSATDKVQPEGILRLLSSHTRFLHVLRLVGPHNHLTPCVLGKSHCSYQAASAVRATRSTCYES